MAGKSIYPSIPAPGNDTPSMRATLDAMRQSLTMITMNAQAPSANFAPSSAAQIFVTKDELEGVRCRRRARASGSTGSTGTGYRRSAKRH